MENFRIFTYEKIGEAVARGPMSREFHIFASHAETRFTLNGYGDTPRRVFSSLFEAIRHARTQSTALDGFVVIYDESARIVNRIPFSIPS